MKALSASFDRLELKYAIGERTAARLREQIAPYCHTDENGSNDSNVALGLRRATKAKDYLVSLGVSSSRIDTVSHGEEKPIDPRHNAAAWSLNNRVKVKIIGGIPQGLRLK